MSAVVENFIRNSDNKIKLTLTEDGGAVSGAWDQLDIHIGRSVLISRTANGNGVTLDESTGLLTISPGDLLPGEIEALNALATTRAHRVQIVVTTTLNDDGAVFGGDGSDRISFRISDKP